MQLSTPTPAPTDTTRLRATLAAATAALLSPALATAQAAAPTPPAARVPWQVDSAVLVYVEGGGRVKALEPVLSLRRTDGNDRTLGLKLTVDTLTGASPNGAVPQPGPQTFTSPSGESRYTVPAGATPLDPSFKDTRGALALSWEAPFGAGQRLALGANVSQEYDFTSLGASAALARDFNDKNTTLSLGLALEQDQLRPVGGAPVGLGAATGTSARGGKGSRSVVDLLFGVTQVMNRRWLTQLNLGLGHGSGDHNDPYKLLSVVDGSTGLLSGDRYVYEQRPDSRSRLSLYWQNKLHLERDIVDLSYRWTRDDWGVRTHTLDLRYRWDLGGGRWLEPRWRHYRQGAADFWRGWLVEGRDWNSSTQRSPLAAASADPRLAELRANTLGLAFGMPLGAGSEVTLRLESYRQQQTAAAAAPGVLQTLDLTPALKATMVTAGWSFSW